MGAILRKKTFFGFLIYPPQILYAHLLLIHRGYEIQSHATI